MSQLDDYLSIPDKQQIEIQQVSFVEAGVSVPLAAKLSRLSYRAACLEIAGISISSDCKAALTARTYFQAQEALDLGWTASSIERLPIKNQWQGRARFALAADLVSNHASITRDILQSKPTKSSTLLDTWLTEHQAGVESIQQTANQLKAVEKPDFPMLSVLMSGLSELV